MTNDTKPGLGKYGIYHDEVAETAKGGLAEDLPPSYYYSPNFLGSVVVSLEIMTVHI